jgi:hypothetical protein
VSCIFKSDKIFTDKFRFSVSGPPLLFVVWYKWYKGQYCATTDRCLNAGPIAQAGGFSCNCNCAIFSASSFASSRSVEPGSKDRM